MARHNQLGKWGEELAVAHLEGLGYAIAQRNWRHNHLEVDIIATKGRRMVFVEVKTRSSIDYDPLQAITPRKKSLLVHAANAYLLSLKHTFEAQFDIITIIGRPGNYTLDHIPDAFIPSLTTR